MDLCSNTSLIEKWVSATTEIQAQDEKQNIVHTHRDKVTQDVNVETHKWEEPREPSYSKQNH